MAQPPPGAPSVDWVERSGATPAKDSLGPALATANSRATAGHSGSARPASAKQICLQCRHRKVRCGGERGGCANCSRLGFACSFASNARSSLDAGNAQQQPEEAHTAALAEPERKRARRACRACHSQKSRCSGTSPSCDRCTHRGQACEYPPSRRYSKLKTPSKPSNEGSSLSLPEIDEDPSNPDAGRRLAQELSDEGESSVSSHAVARTASTSERGLMIPEGPPPQRLIIRQHLDAFFMFIYPIPCYGFFHRATILQKWTADAVPPFLLHAICGAASRFIAKDAEDRKRAALWMDQALMEFHKSSNHLSIANAQMLLITIFHRMSDRKNQSTLMLSAVVTRLVYAMRLNYEDRTLSFTAQESRRRLMWSVFMVNRFLAGGILEYMLCPVETMHLNLPCSERCFEFDLPVQVEAFVPQAGQSDPTNLGSMAYLVRISDIRERILKFTKDLVTNGSYPQDHSSHQEHLERELRELQSTLPASFQFNQRNLILRAYSPHMTRYVMLHIWWHQCHCDLYRMMIPGRRESVADAIIRQTPQEFTFNCLSKCLKHALSIAEIFSEILNLGNDYFILDPLVALCTYQCFRIISSCSFIEPTARELNPEKVMSCMSVCIRSIEKLTPFYPTVVLIHNELVGLMEDFGRADFASFHRRSRSPSPLRGRSNDNPKPRQLLSKYNLIEQGSIEDSQQLELSMPSLTPNSNEPPRQPHSGSLASHYERQERHHDAQQQERPPRVMAVGNPTIVQSASHYDPDIPIESNGMMNGDRGIMDQWGWEHPTDGIGFPATYDPFVNQQHDWSSVVVPRLPYNHQQHM